MPRKGRSAKGAGLPGTASANRTDTQAVRTPTRLPYGEAGALQAGMAQVPLPAQPPLPPAPPGAIAPTATGTGATRPPGAPPEMLAGGSNPAASGLAAVLAAATSMTPPTSPGLSAPTQRPDEPVTAGLPSGPGPGPEALAMAGPSQRSSPLAMTLSATARTTGSAILANLAAAAAAQGL